MVACSMSSAMCRSRNPAAGCIPFVSHLYQQTSVIVAANPGGEWPSVFGDSKMTTALLGRLPHRGGIVEIGSES
jgi:hypothetical protein